MATDLSLLRLTEVLEVIWKRCDTIEPSDRSALERDGVFQERVENWCSANFHDLANAVKDAATLCNQNALRQEAVYWSNIRNAFTRPLPTGDRTSGVDRGDWAQRFEAISQWGRIAREMLHHVEEEFKRQLAEQRKGAGQAAPAGGDDPMCEKRWQLEAGGFWFDDQFYKLTGKPLAMLRVFIGSPRRQTFGYDDLRTAWGDDLTDDGTIRAVLSDLRTVLRNVAADASIKCDDPLPGSQGAWQFVLPR